MQTRRLVTAMLAAAPFMAGDAFAQTPRQPVPDDMVLGKADAPVTVIEYASVGCPHCARFNNEVFPAFKRKYIDTGKVKYVMREMLLGNQTLAGVGFLLARCAGKDKYFQVTDAIYHGLPDWMENNKYNEGLDKIARDAGLSSAQADACIADQAAVDALNARVARNIAADDVHQTPTFVINGVKTTGEKTLEDLDQLIAAAMAARPKR